jgi:hypothetical protein
MNVTPFNSAKGIFIPRIFSSSDIDPPGLLFAITFAQDGRRR